MSRWPNHCLQATPGSALGEFLRLFSGAPEAERSALCHMRFLTLTIALMAVCLTTGCDPPACSICGVGKWIKCSSDKERFEVLMPSKPAVSAPTASAAAGTLTAHVYSAAPSRGYAFCVSHNSFPPEVDMSDTGALLDKICKQAISGDVRLTSSNHVTLHGIPGRDLEYEKQDQVLVRVRTYLRDRDSYQVYCVMPKAAICRTHINEFLESFDLKQK